ncbi:MAG: amino acid adenylation domain-containing protein [Cyanobacteria bacterium P01_F01_bin.150]
MNSRQGQKSISNLSADQKRQLLAQLLEKKKQGQQQKAKQADKQAAQDGRSPKTSQTFPVSFAQQRLWFMDQLQPGSAAYHLPAAFRVTGQLDIAALEQSFNILIQRHEILRTRITVVDEQPVQEVMATQNLSLAIEEMPGEDQWESRQQQDRAVQTIIQTEAARPFDLAEGPLLRVRVFRLKSLQGSEPEYLLICTLHHIISDYWSMRSLIQELGRAYGAIKLDKPGAGLADLPIQYADYAVWQRQWLKGDRCQHQLDYWKQKLAQPPLSVELPTDFPRPMVQSFNGAMLSFSLPKTLTQKLNELSRHQGTTLYMTLLMGLKILLHRYSGQTDILIGSTVANRNRPELANLIGLFVNNLVFRSDLSGNPTVRSLLTQVRDTTLDAYANQDLPFEYLVEVLQPERHLHQNPLFQVMFILHNTPETTELKLPDLTLNYLPLDNQTARFDLSLDMVESPDGLVGNLEYNTDLFKASTIERMVGHFQTLLEAIVEDLDQPIAHLPLLTVAEKEQLGSYGVGELRSWGVGELWSYGVGEETPSALPTVHGWVEYWAGETPDAIAVGFGNFNLTYRQLNQEINQLAQHLISLEVQPDSLVGVCVERSLHMLIALLATHRAGAAYVPIDPTYPQERIQYVLKDAGIQTLIQDSNTQSQNFSSGDASQTEFKIQNCITLGVDKIEGRGQKAEPTPSPSQEGDRRGESLKSKIQNQPTPSPSQEGDRSSDNPKSKIQNLKSKIAYTIYTSGSTGNPKGVQISHGALANLLQSMTDTPGFEAKDKLLAVTTFSFDIAALELFLPLVCGGQVVIASQEDVRDGDRLFSLLNQHDITVMQATPATWRLLLASGWQGKSNLRVLCGGEALDTPLAAELLPKSQSLWNMYGPTETTIWSLCHQVTATNVEGKAAVPIGRAIANTELHVLDAYLQPVPVGIPGELYIGGAGVAIGYLNRAELTSERFVQKAEFKAEGRRQKAEEPTPSPSQEGNRTSPIPQLSNSPTLYKTGDFVRYREDGILEYLGRLDFQVKLRGFRIELGEIEVALGQHPQIQQAVVVLRWQDSDPMLVAYFISKAEIKAEGRRQKAEPTPSPSQEGDRNGQNPKSKIQNPKSSELREFLQKSLPTYMIPSVFVSMETLPLTPNGKVDRKSLPDPVVEPEMSLAQSYVEPSTDTEVKLAEIWTEVLSRDAVSIYDNFFELGGHSLLAARAIARIRQAFKLDIPLQKVFTAPTISGLAQEIEKYGQADGQSNDHAGATLAQAKRYRPDIEPINRDGELPLSFAQQRQWVLAQLEPDNPFYNIPVGLNISGELDMERLQQSMVALLDRHEGLRTTVETVDGRPQVSILEVPKSFGISEIDLMEYSEIEQKERVEAIAQQDAQKTLALDHGPLFRLSILHLAPTQHIALLTLHHLIADAWSIGVIVQDIAQFYAVSGNDALRLSPKTSYEADSPSKIQNLKSKIQYLDYAAWQRNWLKDEVLEEQLEYWRSHLHNSPPLLELPTDYPRPAVQTWHGASHSVHLPAELSQAVRQWSQKHGVTVFMTLLAVFNLLLQRYSDSDDIVVGSPVANRHHAEVERMVGCFANTLALRTDLSGHPSFAELVERVKQTTLDGYNHQDMPFEQIVDALQPERSLSHSPLFQVMFLLQNASMGTMELDGLSWQILDRDSGTAKFDLTLSVTEVKEDSTSVQGGDGQPSIGLVTRWEYNRDLFAADMIQRMAMHWQVLLERAIADSNQPISTLSILTVEEQQRILFEWNRLHLGPKRSQSLLGQFPAGDWELTPPQPSLRSPNTLREKQGEGVLVSPLTKEGLRGVELHGYFETQVERTPEAIALTFDRQQVTYQALNQRANQLAIYLQQLGIQPENLVGVCVDRSIEMIVAILAILKAGAAYVPLDPNYPTERLSWIIDDAQLSALIRRSDDARTTALLQSDQKSNAASVGSAHPTADAPIILEIDGDWDIQGQKAEIKAEGRRQKAEKPTPNPSQEGDRTSPTPQLPNSPTPQLSGQYPISNIQNSSLAYVIYTSGSTGRPKGVAIAHQNAIALVNWARNAFRAEQLAGVLASTSICFDLSVFEMFVPLSVGGTVVLVEDVLQLPELGEDAGLTLINTVPSAARALLAINGIPSTVTTVNLAGEPLPQTLVNQLYEQPHIQAVYNLYGPSEDTTYSTGAQVKAEGAKKAEGRRQKAEVKAEGRRQKDEPTRSASLTSKPSPSQEGDRSAPTPQPKSKIQNPKSATPPIGQPITGTQAYILDRHLQPVPVGVPGELYLAGAGVARGYLNRPDLTGDRFIPNPFMQRSRGSDQISATGQTLRKEPRDLGASGSLTLYKTGDRVLYRPNGDIEYLRRLDHQVKIRGFRIELGEIEAVLRQHPGVAQAVVNPWMDKENQHQQLVAYVVVKNAEDATPSALKKHLQRCIPDYMVPSTVMILDALPLTPNGKIDRRSLPAPEREANIAGESSESVQPQTEREGQLAEIWRSLLGLEQVGIHDNFFALGGDSILAIQAIAKARQVGIHLAPKQLFQYQTIAELAALESSELMLQAEQGLVVGSVPLNPIQRWFFEQEFAEAHHWNQAIMFESLEPIEPQILRQAVYQLLQYHDGLRSQFIRGSNGWQQVIVEKVPDVVTHIDLTTVLPEQQAVVIEQTSATLQSGFSLATGELMRVAVFETGQNTDQILIALHHLLVDGLSWRIILGDLQQIYRDLAQGQSPPLNPPLPRGETPILPLTKGELEGVLPPKSMSLPQWSQTLQDYIQSNQFVQERQYWTEIHRQLTDYSRTLPLDMQDGSNRVMDSSTISLTLTQEETNALLHKVPGAYQTQINDALLTALMMGLTDWSQSEALVIEMEGHGRELLTDSVDLSRTVGWLTSLFPVVLNRLQSKELGIILKSVKEQLREIPNQGIGYGLWRYLDAGQDLMAFNTDGIGLSGSKSLSPVRFNYLGQTDALWSDDVLLKPSQLSAGSLRSPRGDRGVILEINGLVTGGRLRLDWSYSNGLHRKETVYQVAESVMDYLRRLIDHCCDPDAGGYTPSDFPEMSLSQGELDDLLADL